jgi:protoheme IX farnesyltransferase
VKPETVTPTRAGPPAASRTSDFLELTKPGITFLVVITTMAGFYFAAREPFSFTLLGHALLGTALVAAGAGALNMYLERDLDARMRRTSRRPLPTGRMQPEEALAFALSITVAGMIYLFVLVNPLTSLLSAITLTCYLFLYTPLKSRTWLCTLSGAAPGALPVIMGWAAAAGRVETGGWALFAIVFFWQLPHFYAIAWMYREEYARAGFLMLPVVDADGKRTGRHMAFHTVLLLAATAVPSALGMTGPVYLIGAALLGIPFLYLALLFIRKRTRNFARRVFFYSIFYLPALLVLLVLDKALL